MGKLLLIENYTYSFTIHQPTNYIITELEIQIDKFSLLKNHHKEILKNNEIDTIIFSIRMIITSSIDD